jgi:hypothetical protein
MINIVYGLCALTAFACAWLLLRAWDRSGYRMLLWGGLCFAGLTLNNIMVIVDKFLTPPTLDLSHVRGALALTAMITLLYGLIWDAE